MRHWFVCSFTIALAVAIAGCSSTVAGVTKGVLDKMFEPSPTSIEATFLTSDFVNPDSSNRPSPIIVRFYELSSVGSFESTDFFALYEQDEDVLGTDLQAREELQFAPGEKRSFERELRPDTRYVAVMAAYRDIENATWRAFIEVELNEKTPLIVKLEKLSVSIEVEDD